jgi:uncharacterized membrane protein
MLVYLLFIVCMPFSTMVVGRYGDLPPAVWLYAGNMIASSLVGWRLSALAISDGREIDAAAPRAAIVTLLVSAVLSVAISLVAPRWAMYAYLLNLIGVIRTRRRRKSA